MKEASLNLELTRSRVALLASFALATVLLIPLHWHGAGAVVWSVALWFSLRDPVVELRRRMGVLLVCVAILAACDINTSTSPGNFLQVGLPFALVVVMPAMILGRTDPGVIRFRIWPRKRWRHDAIYALISIPLSWAILKFYWAVNPDLYLQWTLPPEPSGEEIGRLFAGINFVGVWDELFFVNTVFAVLRSLFKFVWANALQAVVYTSVLYDMAFVGIGPLIVFYFAWTQGLMFERSENLFFVLLVHLIVDYFLVAAIVNSYYPGYGMGFLWRHGF